MTFWRLCYDLENMPKYPKLFIAFLSTLMVTFIDNINRSSRQIWKNTRSQFCLQRLLYIFNFDCVYIQKRQRSVLKQYSRTTSIYLLSLPHEMLITSTHIHHVDELIWPQMKITSNKIEKTKNQDLRMVAQSISMCSLDLVLNCM